MKSLNLSLAVMCLLFPCAASHASLITLGATDAANGPISNGSASINVNASQAAIGSGSWQANGTAVSQYYLYQNTFANRGLGQIKVSDLNSLSFSTYKTTTGGSAPDWYLIIYTAHTGVNDEASWYGHRLILEGLYANNFANPANQWNTWSTDSGVNQLTLNDSGLSGNMGFYNAPTLANAQSGSINWNSFISSGSSTAIDYRNLDIMGIVLSTGNPWANGFTGLVDDVNINTAKGDLQFDLEATAVPEASTIIAGILLLLPFGLSGAKGVYRRWAQ